LNREPKSWPLIRLYTYIYAYIINKIQILRPVKK